MTTARHTGRQRNRRASWAIHTEPMTKELRSAFDALNRREDYLQENLSQLIERYPEQWAAVGPDGLVAVAKSHAGLVRMMKARGLRGRGVKVVWLTRHSQHFIL